MQEIMQGTTIENIKGDTRSLDYSSSVALHLEAGEFHGKLPL